MKYQVMGQKYKSIISFYFTNIKDARKCAKRFMADNYQIAIVRYTKNGTQVECK